MATVKLIRHHSGFDNVPDSFVVLEPGFEHTIDPYTEEVAEYELPDGYKVAKSNTDESEIYTADNKHCEVVMHQGTGGPMLAHGQLGGTMPTLKRVQQPEG